MIENKNKYMKNKLFNNLDLINKEQKKYFSKIEKTNFKGLNKRLIRSIESKKPKKIIREPKLISLLAKIYLLFH